jgi:ABC-type nitrate/sulfonate/bicarbonate transport system substrate-binding protein
VVISTVFTNKRRIGLFCLVLFLVVLVTSSGYTADKIRIGYSGVTVSNAMLWVTDEGKLFQKNGIDPQILYLRTTLGQTAMIAGEVDMCVYSGSLLSSARLQGADVVMVTSFLDRPLYRLVVRPEIGLLRISRVRDWGSRVSAPSRIR